MNPALLNKSRNQSSSRLHATREAAIEAFVRDWRERLARSLAVTFASQLGRDAVFEAVDEAIADAFAEWQSEPAEAGRPVHNESKVYAFIALRARRVLIAAVRHRAAAAAPVYGVGADVVEQVLDRHAASPEDVWIEREAASQVREALAELDEEALSVLELRHVENFKKPQIAQLLALTEKQVRTRLRNANEVLHERYRDVEAGTTCAAGQASVLRFAFDLVQGAEARRARAHIGHCAHCRQRYERARAFRRSVAGLVPLPLAVHPSVAGAGLLDPLRLHVTRLLGHGGEEAQRSATSARGGTGALAAAGAKIAGMCAAGAAVAGGLYCAINGLPGEHPPATPARATASAAVPLTRRAPTAAVASSALEHARAARAAARAAVIAQRYERRVRAAAPRKRAAARRPIQTDEFFSPAATPSGGQTAATTTSAQPPAGRAPTQTSPSSSPDEFPVP